MNHAIKIQVLYDKLLNQQIGNLTKKAINKTPFKDPLTYGDINGKVVEFPVLVFPYRRVLLWVAQSAYEGALSSSESHQCALESNLDEAEWNATFADIGSDCQSSGFNESQFMMNM